MDSIDYKPEQNSRETGEFKVKLAFLLGITFASGLGGFGVAVATVKKRSPKFSGDVHEEGAKLAMRALGWGTMFAVGGVTTLGIAVKSVYELKKVIFS